MTEFAGLPYDQQPFAGKSDAYPEIDFERVSEIAASLADAGSDAEAISRVLRVPCFVVHQKD